MDSSPSRPSSMLNLKESRNEGENYVFQIAQKLNEMKKKSLMKLNIWVILTKKVLFMTRKLSKGNS